MKRYCRQLRIIDIPSARTLRAGMALPAPSQPLQTQSPGHPARAISPCPKDSPAETVSSSPQPCPAHPWDLLSCAVSPFWPHPISITPREVPVLRMGLLLVFPDVCSWLDRAGTGLSCLMEIPMEAHRESQVLSKVLEWGCADAFNFRIQLLYCSNSVLVLFAYSL